MRTLTVFTPTYNRAYCLHQCYESLKRQTCKDFEWLIIDDGSTDHTKQLVERWRAESAVPITYVYQDNQGMHGAHNTAYETIRTELNVCIDSDDYMPRDAVENIVCFWKKHGSRRVSGLVGLDAFPDGSIIGTKLPEDRTTSTLFDLYHKHGVKGDKKLVYRTELTRSYPYPLFDGERYVGLAYKYYKLDEQYELLLMNKVLCCVEYLPDGSSLNMLSQYRNNPKGFAFYRKELMQLPFADTAFKFRQASHYISSCLLAKNWRPFRDVPLNAWSLPAVLPGFMLYLLILARTRTPPARER